MNEDLRVLEWLEEACRSGEARRIRQLSRTPLADVAREVVTTATTVNRWELARRRPRNALQALRYASVLKRLETAEIGQGKRVG